MDKNKLIDEILTEWAMRSPDGLASGHDTPENMAVLEELVLMNYGMTGTEFDTIVENSVNEIGRSKGSIEKKYIDTNAAGEAVIGNKYRHYKYPPGTKISDIVSGKKVKTWSQYNKQQGTRELNDKERKERIKKNRYEDFASPNGKRAGRIASKWMKAAIDSSGYAGKKFFNMYDSLSRDEAIKIYNSPEYKDVIDAVEGREKKGLGRGELVFTWLMAGYRSGGTQEVDLVFGSVDKDIEMKELTGKNKRPVIGISAPTLKGYYNTQFRLAVDELATEIRKSGNKKLDPSSDESFDFKKNPCLATFLVHVFENYPGAEGGDKVKMLRSLKNFCTLLRTTEMPTNLFNALAAVWKKLETSQKNEPGIGNEKETAKATVVVGGEKQEFPVDPVGARAELKSISAKNKNSLDLDIADPNSVGDKTEKDYRGEAKNLLYFSNKYTIDKISKEIRKLLKTKYSGLIIIDKRSGNHAKFVPADAEFTFTSLGLNKINLVLPGEKDNASDSND